MKCVNKNFGFSEFAHYRAESVFRQVEKKEKPTFELEKFVSI